MNGYDTIFITIFTGVCILKAPTILGTYLAKIVVINSRVIFFFTLSGCATYHFCNRNLPWRLNNNINNIIPFVLFSGMQRNWLHPDSDESEHYTVWFAIVSSSSSFFCYDTTYASTLSIHTYCVFWILSQYVKKNRLAAPSIENYVRDHSLKFVAFCRGMHFLTLVIRKIGNKMIFHKFPAKFLENQLDGFFYLFGAKIWKLVYFIASLTEMQFNRNSPNVRVYWSTQR